MKLLLSLSLSLILFVSCKKQVEETIALPEKVLIDVAYGPDPKQNLDVYLPAGRTDTTKFIVLIHGGAWSHGDKSDWDPYMPVIRERLKGYAIFNINYRLASPAGNFFPTQENDIKSAIQLIHSRIKEYSISEKMVLMGSSAGAHLSLLHGYKHNAPLKAKAIVSFFGPTDMEGLFNMATGTNKEGLALLLGGTPSTNAQLYQQSSPLFFAGQQSPPTILLQGGIDEIVPSVQAVVLKNKLQSSGAVVEYVFYPNEGHGWFGSNLEDSFERILAFIRAQVK